MIERILPSSIHNAEVCRIARPQRAGSHRAIRMRRINQHRTLRRIFLRQKLLHRNLAKARIAVVRLHIRVRQLHRFNACVQLSRAVRTRRISRKPLHDVQHLQRGDAVTIRRQLINCPVAIRGVDRLDPLRRIRSEIVRRHRSAQVLRRLQNRLRNFALVKRRLALLRNKPERTAPHRDCERPRQSPAPCRQAEIHAGSPDLSADPSDRPPTTHE